MQFCANDDAAATEHFSYGEFENWLGFALGSDEVVMFLVRHGMALIFFLERNVQQMRNEPYFGCFG